MLPVARSPLPHTLNKALLKQALFFNVEGTESKDAIKMNYVGFYCFEKMIPVFISSWILLIFRRLASFVDILLLCAIFAF